MPLIDKRIDIMLNKITRKRAYITYNPDEPTKAPTISYNNKSYHSADEFEESVKYEYLIISDDECYKILKKHKYKVKHNNRRKETLNLSLNKNLVEKIRNDAYDQEQSVSTIVEQILKDYYKN